MKKFKIALSLVLALCMLLTAVPMLALADEPATSGTKESIDWSYDATTKTITISGNIGNNKTGTIPYSTANEFSALDYDIIVVEEGIGEIIANGLNGCKAVDIILPKSLRKIDDYAFKNASRLVNLTIPEGVITLGGGIVQNASALKYVYFPSTVINANGNALLDSPKATMTVYMADGWTWQNAFKPCKGISYDKGYTTSTADTVNRKADGTFAYGTIADLTAEAVSGDTIYCLRDYKGTTEPQVAEGVKVVYMGAAGASGTWKSQKWILDIKTSTITVEPVGSNTAIGDNSGNSLWSAGQIGNAYGVNCKKVIIGEGFTTVLKFGLMDCPAEEIVFPSTLESIAQESLQGIAVKSLEFPKGFKSIGAYPFKGLNLDYMYIPSTVETFGGSWWQSLTVTTIYYGVSSKNSAEIVNRGQLTGVNRVAVNAIKVTADGTKTYGDFKALVNGSVAGDTVTLVDTISASADQYDNNKDDMPTVGTGTIKYYPNVTVSNKFRGAIWTYDPAEKEIVMESKDPVNGTSIGKADENYSYPNTAWKKFDYNKLVIGEGIYEIQKMALSGCKAIDVQFPSTLKTIGDSAFSDAAIKDVILPYGMESVTQYPFKRCALNSIYFPSTLTNLANWYTDLKSVETIYYSRNAVIESLVLGQLGGGAKNAEGGKPVCLEVNATVNYAETGETEFVNLYAVRNDLTTNDAVTLITDFNKPLLLVNQLDIYTASKDILTTGIFYLNTNDDDNIDILDLIKMKKYLAGTDDVYQGNLQYDLTKGATNLVYLRKYILGEELSSIEN